MTNKPPAPQAPPTTIQEIIHRFEEGAWVKWFKLGTGLLVLIALTAWYDLREYKNFGAPEAMEAAQLGRNLSRGEGFNTQVVRPFGIHLVDEKQGVQSRLSKKPHPDIYQAPLYPVFLAGLMKVLPFKFGIGGSFWRYQPEFVIALVNQALFFLSVFLCCMLARRLFDNAVAVALAILLLGCEVLWGYSCSGLSTMLIFLFLNGLIWSMVRLDEGTREEGRTTAWFVGWAVLAGVCLGAATLTRYSVGWLVLPVLLYGYWFLGARRALVCGIVAGLFFLMLAPWMWRNFQVCGSPLGVAGYAVMEDTLQFPGTTLERMIVPDFNKLTLDDIFRKFLVNGAAILQGDLPRLGGSWITAFFLVGLLFPFRSVTLSRLRWWTLWSLGIFVVVQALGRTYLSNLSPTYNTENVLVLLLPWVFMFGTGFFFVLLDQMELPFMEARRYVVILFLGVGCSSLVLLLLPPRSYPMVYPPYLPTWIHEASGFMTKREAIMTDAPWAVAWYGDRTAIWNTLDVRRSFYTINDEHKGISAVFLTPLTTDQRFLTQVLRGQEGEWGALAVEALIKTNLPPRFPLQDARLAYAPDHLLLCDRPRWREKAR